MGDEASKKDLQNLQANVNKQIAELKKQIDSLKTEFNKGLDEENKITVTARGDLEKEIKDLDSRFLSRSTEIQNSINALARAIGDIANKVNK